MNDRGEVTHSVPRCRALSEFQIAFLFLVATLVLYFAAAPFYFLYEDDYYHVGIPATQTYTWVWDQIKIVWQTWPQGRPGMFMTPAFLGMWIHLTGSVAAGYIPAFFIVATNAYLTYRVLLHRLPQTASLAGALFALVSCADPHKILLTHTTLQIALTLNLLGLLLYLKQRPVLGYLIAGTSLLFYEISFAIFACAELLYCINAPIRWKRLFFTWGAWLAVAGSVFGIRYWVGETRAAEAASDVSELLRRIATNVTWGPVYGIENSYLHPFGLLIKQANPWYLVIALAVVIGLGKIVMGTATEPVARNNPGTRFNLWAMLGVVLVLTFGPYALQLKRTVFPGFMRPVSGYHLCLGLAHGFAVAMILANSQPYRRLHRSLSLALLVLACASAYQNLIIQNDYARSARYQAHFWGEMQRTAADALPGDVVLISNQHLSEAEYVLANSWGLAHAWLVLFKQTGPLKDWANVPSERPVTVFPIGPGWEKNITSGTDGPYLNYADYTPPGFRTGQIPLVDDHVIILEANYSGPFLRRTEPIVTESGKIRLKTRTPQSPVNLGYTRLAKYLFVNFID